MIEYSYNYSDTSGSSWQFKRDEVPANADLTINNSQSFKYKAALKGKTANHNNSFVRHKIVVPLQYLSNFLRSLEILLINRKVHLELNWIEECMLSSATAKFKITDAKLHVPLNWIEECILSSAGDCKI